MVAPNTKWNYCSMVALLYENGTAAEQRSPNVKMVLLKYGRPKCKMALLQYGGPQM